MAKTHPLLACMDEKIGYLDNKGQFLNEKIDSTKTHIAKKESFTTQEYSYIKISSLVNEERHTTYWYWINSI